MAAARHPQSSGKVGGSPWLLAGLLAAGAVAFLLVAFATTWGAGISPDSVRFVGAARGILAGQGVSVLAGDGTPVPLTKWPPAFPLLLAIPGLWSVDALEAARWENALFFGGNVMLTVVAAWRATGGSRLAAAAAGALILVSVDQLYVHSMIWTEPSFIFFSLAAILALAGYLSGSGKRALFASGAACGLALLDRYAGAALALTVAGSVVLWGRGTWRSRLVAGATVAAFAGSPLLMWALHNQALAGTATSRAFEAVALLPGQIPLALDAISAWLLPVIAPVELRTLALLAVAVCCGALWWRSRPERAPDPGAGLLVRAMALYAVVYLAVLAASITFMDPPPVPVDFRLMSALYPPAVVLAVASASPALRAGARPSRWRRVAAALFSFLVLVSMARALPWLAQTNADGLWYASRAWRQSRVIALVDALPPGVQLYSNATDAIYALTGRPGFPLPPVSSFETGEPNGGFLDQIEIVRSGMSGTGGYIVYCRAASWRTNLPSESDLVGLLGLQIVAEARDGAIYRLSPWPRQDSPRPSP